MTDTSDALADPRGLVLRDLRGAAALRALHGGTDADRAAALVGIEHLADRLQGRWAVAQMAARFARPTAIDGAAAAADLRYARALAGALAPAAQVLAPAPRADDPVLAPTSSPFQFPAVELADHHLLLADEPAAVLVAEPVPVFEPAPAPEPSPAAEPDAVFAAVPEAVFEPEVEDAFVPSAVTREPVDVPVPRLAPFPITPLAAPHH